MADFSYNIVGSGDLSRCNEELRLHPGRAIERKTRKQLNGIEFEPDPKRILLRETALITQVYRAFGFPSQVFDRMISTALGRLATYVNNLPASLSYHHHETGGLFRHSLEAGFECVRIQDTQILTRAEYEERARATLMWGVCAFFGGILHDIGKPLVNFEVRDAETAEKWNPFTESLQDWGMRIGCRSMIVTEAPMLQPKLHEKYMLWGAQQIIPQEVFAYFGQVQSEDIAQALLTALSDNTKKSQLREIIEEADRNSVRDYCAKHTYSGYDTFSTRADHLLLYAIDTFLSTGEYKLNEPNQPFWMVGGEFFIAMDSLSLSQVNVLLSSKNRPKIPQQTARLVAVLGDCDFIFQTESTEQDKEGRVVTSRSPYWFLKPEGCDTAIRVVRLKDNKPLRRYQTYSISGTFAPKDGFTPSEVSITSDSFRSSGLQGFPQIEFPEPEEPKKPATAFPDKGNESKGNEGPQESNDNSSTAVAEKATQADNVVSTITTVVAKAAKFSGWLVGQFMKGLNEAYLGSADNNTSDKFVTEKVKQEQKTENPGREGNLEKGEIGGISGASGKPGEPGTSVSSADTEENRGSSTVTAENPGSISGTGNNPGCSTVSASVPGGNSNTGSVPVRDTDTGSSGENVEQGNGATESTRSQNPTSTPPQNPIKPDETGTCPCQGKMDFERIFALLPQNAVLLDTCPLTVKGVEKKSILWRSFKSFTELKNTEKITVQAGTAQSDDEEELAREIMYALPIDLTEYAVDESLTRRVVSKTLALGRDMLPVLLRYKEITRQPGGITRHPLMEYLPFWLMAAYGIEKFPEVFTYYPDTGILVLESYGIASSRMKVHEREVIAARLAFLGETHYFSIGKEPDFGVVLADQATASMLHLLTTDHEKWNQPALNTWVQLTNGGLGLSEIAQGMTSL